MYFTAVARNCSFYRPRAEILESEGIGRDRAGLTARLHTRGRLFAGALRRLSGWHHLTMIRQMGDALCVYFSKRRSDHRDVDHDGVHPFTQQDFRESGRIVICNADVALNVPHQSASLCVRAFSFDQQVVECRPKAMKVALIIINSMVLAISGEALGKGLCKCFLARAALDPRE